MGGGMIPPDPTTTCFSVLFFSPGGRSSFRDENLPRSESQDSGTRWTARTRTAPACPPPPASVPVLLTHRWETLHSCLFNYANAHVYS